MLDLDPPLALVGDGLVPDLRDEGVVSRRSHQIRVQIDTVPVLIEKDAHGRAEH